LQQGTLSPYCNSPLGNAGLSAPRDFCTSAFAAPITLPSPENRCGGITGGK
jgi:hypothetical protein